MPRCLPPCPDTPHSLCCYRHAIQPYALTHRTAALCSSCHRQVHKLFTEKELERSYHTVELLLAHPAVLEWVGWVGKRPNWR